MFKYYKTAVFANLWTRHSKKAVILKEFPCGITPGQWLILLPLQMKWLLPRLLLHWLIILIWPMIKFQVLFVLRNLRKGFIITFQINRFIKHRQIMILCPYKMIKISHNRYIFFNIQLRFCRCNQSCNLCTSWKSD